MPTDGGEPFWSDVAPDRNKDDIGDYRNRPKVSIWDGSDHTPYDKDEEDDREDDRRREEDDRRKEVSRGWFGDEDLDDARWGAASQRRHIMDPETGGPIRRHGFGEKNFSGGSVRYGGPVQKAKQMKKKTRAFFATEEHRVKWRRPE